jgi:hypothetical protein
MHTNILIVMYFENGVLPCVLRNDCFRQPLELNEISEGEEGCVPKSNDALCDIKRYGIQ